MAIELGICDGDHAKVVIPIAGSNTVYASSSFRR